MSEELKEYKCPCCGGSIEFDAKTQNMKCPFCATQFDIKTLEEYACETENDRESEMNWNTSAGLEWDEKESASLDTYICKSCGGEIICEHTTAATACPYCSNPVILKENVSGTLKPDLVIPFKIDKNTAIETLRSYYGKKKLLPKVFSDKNRIKEVKGVYVPFWLYDANAEANIRYRATRVRTWADSNYYYTETSFWSVIRDGSLAFSKVPVDGSEKMQDELMESIEPFDYSDAVDFNTAYLSGFLADKYDVSSEESIKRANERIKKSTEDAFNSTVLGYATVIPEHTSIRLCDGHAKYALFPVWLLNTEYEGKTYTFAMNGQTGKTVGDLPLDRGAYIKWFAALTAVTAAASFLISYLVWLL